MVPGSSAGGTEGKPQPLLVQANRFLGPNPVGDVPRRAEHDGDAPCLRVAHRREARLPVALAARKVQGMVVSDGNAEFGAASILLSAEAAASADRHSSGLLPAIVALLRPVACSWAGFNPSNTKSPSGVTRTTKSPSGVCSQ